MSGLHVATLLSLGLVYGVGVGLLLAGSFDPAGVCGAFVLRDECRAALERVSSASASGEVVTHVLAMAVRLEGLLWAGLGLSMLAAVRVRALRAGVFAVGALSLGFAALAHAHHQGCLPGVAAPWHARPHGINVLLMALDGLGCALCAASLATSSLGNHSKAKEA